MTVTDNLSELNFSKSGLGLRLPVCVWYWWCKVWPEIRRQGQVLVNHYNNGTVESAQQIEILAHLDEVTK